MERFKLKQTVKPWLYLNSKERIKEPANKFPKEIVLELAKLFAEIYNANVLERTKNIKVTEKERGVLNYCFQWAVCSPSFKGDLAKGIYLVSDQGFGKDVILKTIIDFYNWFDLGFTQYTFPDFCVKWFENDPYKFKSPIKINDIKGMRKMKREKESIPFLELLDYRDQVNNRRSLLVSSNLLPLDLQEQMEDEGIKRTEERVKECFNILLVSGVESKRIDNTTII